MTQDKNLNEKPRWQYRFDHFKRAYFLLQESMDQKKERGLNQLEKEGVIQRFEYCIELAWKTLKDYLEYQHVQLEQITPRFVIKEAFTSKLIPQADLWMEALDVRNQMSHVYDFQEFEKAIQQIEAKYLDCFSELYEKLGSLL
jgi:nucleotidyltransferase substrate binding protein (TIGR01987 family)